MVNKKSEEYVQNALDNFYICCATCKYYINDGTDKCKKTYDKSNDCFYNRYSAIATRSIDGVTWTGKYANKYTLWEKKRDKVIIKKLNDELFRI